VEELGPWDQAFLAACGELGYPTGRNFNDPDLGEQASPFPINAVGTVRWNAAFAYLDAARARPNLSILAETLVDRVTTLGGRVTAVHALQEGQPVELAADQVIVAAGTYASPAILQRSGIGQEASLGRLGITVVERLDGVGANLIDHAGTWMQAAPAAALLEAVAARRDQLYECSAMLKAASAVSATPYDLHLLPWTDPVELAFRIYPKLVKPRSVGCVTIVSNDPSVLPQVDHGYLSDPDGHDLDAVVDSLRIGRRVLEASEAIERVLAPDVNADLREHVLGDVGGYFHPVGSCRMGTAGDPLAVVDASCRVLGVENLVIADASVMPTIPTANTNLTVAAIAERVAATMMGAEGSGEELLRGDEPVRP